MFIYMIFRSPIYIGSRYSSRTIRSLSLTVFWGGPRILISRYVTILIKYQIIGNKKGNLQDREEVYMWKDAFYNGKYLIEYR